MFDPIRWVLGTPRPRPRPRPVVARGVLSVGNYPWYAVRAECARAFEAANRGMVPSGTFADFACGVTAARPGIAPQTVAVIAELRRIQCAHPGTVIYVDVAR